MSALVTWASLRDPRNERAKQRLAVLPPSETGHGAAVPFPFLDKQGYKGKHSNHEINHSIEHAPIGPQPLEGLHAIQHSVKPHHVRFYIDHPDARPMGARHASHHGLIDYPIVIQQDGTRYIHDGHHRLTADLLRGLTSADVRFVDFDKEHDRG